MSNETRLKADPTALALVVIPFAEHLFNGGDRLDFSLAFAVVNLVFLVVLIAVSRGTEPSPPPLTVPAVLLGAVYALAVFSVLPLGPPLAHPLWAYVQKIEPGVAATISLDPTGTRIQLVKLTGYVAIFLIGASVGGRREGAEQTLRYLTAAGIVYGLCTVGLFALDPRSIFGSPISAGAARLTGPFRSSNTNATLLACFAVIALAGALRPLLRAGRDGRRVDREAFGRQWPSLALGLLSVVGLLLTASRGGLMALTAGILFVLGLAVWVKSARSSLTGGFVGAVCLVLAACLTAFLVGGTHVAERLGDTNLKTADRTQFLIAYWPIIKASPWLGYGLGSFPSIDAMSVTLQNAIALTGQGTAHNVYIQWLLQEGFLGALAMFGAVGLVLAATVRGVLRRASQQWIGLACLGVAVVFAVHGLTDFALEIPSMAAFFAAMLGLGFGLAERPSGGRRR